MKRATDEPTYAKQVASISIHALVKRATQGILFLLFGLAISIHALVKRATTLGLARLQYRPYFNPRPREEGDYDLTEPKDSNTYFNPRPREEGDTVNVSNLQ